MARRNIIERTSIIRNDSKEGLTIETELFKISSQKEPMPERGAIEMITQRRSVGVEAGNNIRTDRFDVAIDAQDKVVRARIAKRDEAIKLKDSKDKKDIGGASQQSEN